MTEREIKKAIDFVTSNEEAIKSSQTAACYQCCSVFPAQAVVEFLEEERTALCPECGIDSVLPDTSGYEFTEDSLRELHEYWFERSTLFSEFVKHFCPACGFHLGFIPWNQDSGSQEICPCCNIQFGYDDNAGGDLNRKKAVYKEWREKWIAEGSKWHFPDEPRKNWDPQKQLKYYLDHIQNDPLNTDS